MGIPDCNFRPRYYIGLDWLKDKNEDKPNAMTEENTEFYLEAVKRIKTAILQSRYLAARLANGEQLKLYFNIGGYVSDNTR